MSKDEERRESAAHVISSLVFGWLVLAAVLIIYLLYRL